jgi:hypothetical protein
MTFDLVAIGATKSLRMAARSQPSRVPGRWCGGQRRSSWWPLSGEQR